MKYNSKFLKRILLVAIMMVACSYYASAQTTYGSTGTWTGKETKEERIRRQIDIDMSVADYMLTKPDPKVMGWRLAKMIEAIQSNYQQSTYNRRISSIRYEQTEDPRIRFAETEKLTFISAEKKDSVIVLKWHTYTKLETKEKVNYDIIMRFVNGISDSESVNNLFAEISRYIRADED